MVREHDLAMDVLQNSFLSAWLNLQKRAVTGNVKAWLYTIARNSAISELRRRKRTVSIGDDVPDGKYPPAFARIDADRMSDPQHIVADGELADLVWTSAAALSAREYSLLDLHVRRGLGTEELSRTLGVPKSNLYTQLSRLKDSLEESVTVNLLMRRARKACPELDTLAAAAGAGFTRDARQTIARHIRECERCRESRKRYLAPAEIFAGLALVPAPAEPERLWLGATAGAGFFALLLTTLLAPFRWILGVVKGSGAPIKAALGTTAVATIAVPAILVSIIDFEGGSSPARPAPAAAGIQPQLTRAAVVTPSAQSATPTPDTAPAPPPPQLAAVAAALASPVVIQAAVSTPGPTPTPTATPPSSAQDANPAATPTPLPAELPKAIAVQIQFTPPKNAQPHSSATFLVTIFGTQTFLVSDLSLPTVRLAGAHLRHDLLKDVDSDGHPDMMLHFKLSEMTVPASGEVCLEGKTLAGFTFAGCAVI